MRCDEVSNRRGLYKFQTDKRHRLKDLMRPLAMGHRVVTVTDLS